MQEAEHGDGLRHVAFNLSEGAALRAGRGEGEFEHGTQAAVSLNGDAPALAGGLADQHECELTCEDFIIGQAFARIGIAGVGVDAGERLVPCRPVLASKQTGFDPFGEIWGAAQRLGDEIAQAVIGEAFGKAVDWLSRRDGGGFLRRKDIVGMDDLEIFAIGLQLAGDEFGFVQGQQFAWPGAVAAEIDQRDRIAVPVLRNDAERRAGAAGRAIVGRREFYADDPP